MSRKQKKAKKGKPSMPPSSNWAALKPKLHTKPPQKSKGGAHPLRKRKRKSSKNDDLPQTEIPAPSMASTLIRSLRGHAHDSPTILNTGMTPNNGAEASGSSQPLAIHRVTDSTQIGSHVALDCEMVGVGPDGKESSLARVSIVNLEGHLVLDTYVRQREAVTDYRTEFSGVRPQDVYGPHALPFQDVQKQVADIMQDRVLVGHALENDLRALMLKHPSPMTRDTQRNSELREKYKTTRTALKVLAKQELGLNIQSGEHSSVVDAQATMQIYRKYQKNWEKQMRMSSSRSSIKLQKRKVADSKGDNVTASEASRKQAVQSAKIITAKQQFAIEAKKASKKTSSGISVVVNRRDQKKLVLGKGRLAKKGPKGGAADVGGGASKATSANWWKS